jgi:hypothetical protein
MGAEREEGRLESLLRQVVQAEVAAQGAPAL